MKKIILLFATLLLLASVSALEIEAKYDTNIIIQDFENTIELELEISNAIPGTYNLYTLADLSIQPSATFEINDSFFKKTFTIKPTSNLDATGNYAFTYTLNHRGIEKYEQKMLLEIKDLSNTIEIDSNLIDPSSTAMVYDAFLFFDFSIISFLTV